MMAEPAEQFREAIRRRLGVDPGAIALDGKVKRFATKPNGRDEAGWCVGFGDGIPAGSFGDWRVGLSETWCARDIRPCPKRSAKSIGAGWLMPPAYATRSGAKRKPQLRRRPLASGALRKLQQLIPISRQRASAPMA